MLEGANEGEGTPDSSTPPECNQVPTGDLRLGSWHTNQ